MEKKRILKNGNADQEKSCKIQDRRPQPFADQIAEISRNFKRIRDKRQDGKRNKQDQQEIEQNGRIDRMLRTRSPESLTGV